MLADTNLGYGDWRLEELKLKARFSSSDPGWLENRSPPPPECLVLINSGKSSSFTELNDPSRE